MMKRAWPINANLSDCIKQAGNAEFSETVTPKANPYMQILPFSTAYRTGYPDNKIL